MLRPFFGYYGGKWRDTPKRYPPPAYDTIIEPFAGSAGYSLRYADRRVVLYDVDSHIVSVWDYLIRVSAAEILAIPDVEFDGSVHDLGLCQEARWLVGFWLGKACERPRLTPLSWMRSGRWPGSFWGDRVRRTIASQLDAIRHWRTALASYETIADERATWFVDPPYEAKGVYYRFGSSKIDYRALASWCRTRTGQVIVCENAGASWLPFQEIDSAKTARKGQRTREAVWISSSEAPAVEQNTP